MHNKKMNVGIIFSILSNSLLEMSLTKQDAVRNRKRISEVQNVIKKYFGKGTEINKEIKVFNEVLSTIVKDKSTAIRLVNALLKESENFNAEKSLKEKNALLNECYKVFGNKDWLKSKIKNYQVYGSIGTLMESRMGRKSLSVKDTILLEDSIAEYMTREPEKLVIESDSDMDDLMYYHMYEAFNQQHLADKNDDQKDTIFYYIKDAKCDINNMRSYFLKGLREANHVIESFDASLLEDYMQGVSEQTMNTCKEDAKILKEEIEKNELNDSMFDRFLDIQQVTGDYKSYVEELNNKK